MKLGKCPQTLALVLLGGCAQPNHLGNPLLLPARAVTNAIGEAGYTARRARVKAYLSKHRSAFQSGKLSPDLTAGLFETARVPGQNQPKVLIEIKSLPPSDQWEEQATVIVMVHS